MFKISEKWIKRIEKGLLIIGLGLIATGLIFSLIFNVMLAPCTERSFYIKTAPDLPVNGHEIDIDCILWEPKSEYDLYPDARPAAVLVHGYSCSNIFMRGIAYELNRRGFVCLSITARGHSGSSGIFGTSFENETLSAIKYLRDYNKSLKIDTNRIGIVGHSMGAITVTLASIIDQELENYWINSTVSIAGPFANQSEQTHGLTGFLSTPYLFPNIDFDPETAINNSIIIGRTNNTRPYNYLNIIGTLDEAFTVESAQEVLYESSTSSFWNTYGITEDNYTMIQNSITYGSHENGSARRLYVLQNIDHLMECQRSLTCIETINWFESSMKLSPATALDTKNVYEDYRGLAPWFVVLGVLFLSIPLVIYTGNWKQLKPNMKPLSSHCTEMNKKEMWKTFSIYAAGFLGISLVAGPIIHFLGLVYIIPTDFIASNFISLPFLIQGIMTIIFMTIIVFYEANKYGLKTRDFGITRNWKSNLKSLIFGFLIFSVINIIMNLGFSAVYYDLRIYQIYSVIELAIYLFIGFFATEMIRGTIQNKLSRYKGVLIIIPNWKEVLGSAIISGLITGLGFGISITFLLSAAGLNIFSLEILGMNLPLFLIVPAIFIFIEIIFSVIMGFIYRKGNRNILAGAIFMAIFLAWALSVFTPNGILNIPRISFLL
ncbi:MAG: alpha/beta fold hydrolase [Candidatus Lokiarchaeota archaeon]|nr:alpha/beta fold hydrolase [Candidatus Lokiarchaeota archaeon]